MSLQFYIGGANSNREKKLHEDIIADAIKNPNKQYIIIVPDQYTMQTQKDLVMEHPDHGIMNIDVLSFGRLTYRVLEEVGKSEVLVIDDTGKSLLLQKLAEELSPNLKSMGSNLNKIGYIHEVKSAISEFMQYGITPDKLSDLVQYASNKKALKGKLEDLQLLYRAFMQEIENRMITKEEKLSLLRRNLAKSKLIPGSVIAFDGFTGFTPIQYQVIEELLVLAEQVKVSILLDANENPYKLGGEQKLFYLSKKTIQDLKKCAERVSVPEVEPVIIASTVGGDCKTSSQEEGGVDSTMPMPTEGEGDSITPMHSKEIAHLEQNLFRYPFTIYDKEVKSIHLSECSNVREELRQVCIRICKLLREKQYCYRDIAVVAGDLSGYANEIETVFAEYKLPIYMDYTRAVMLNPFIEFIRSAMQVVLQDFSMIAVLHFLRCGLTDIELEDVDLIENYLRKKGIRRKKQWERVWKLEDVDAQSYINGLREKVLAIFEPFYVNDGLHNADVTQKSTVEQYARELYDFLICCNMQGNLEQKAMHYTEIGEATLAKEYTQIYGLVMELLDQIVELLGKDELERKAFVQILEAGFGEIQIGTIPQEVDRILIGDMERTRLKPIKVLFFIGVNDGNIPRNANKGGIISDIDREFLKQAEIELAPTPRQQMFIQRLYLYMNMTKPSEALYISYAQMQQSGAGMRPSYLIEVIKQLFPQIEIEHPEKLPESEQMESEADIKSLFASNLREYALGVDLKERQTLLASLYRVLKDMDIDQFVETAFYSYEHTPLGKEIAKALYGQILAGSVSRLEKYCECAYGHFLQYGMALQLREEYAFERVDMGNLFHQILEQFGQKLVAEGMSWFDFSREQGDAFIDQIMEESSTQYGDAILYSSARNRYFIQRMTRIMKRTVKTLQEQLCQGKFVPDSYEIAFEKLDRLDAFNVALSKQEKMKLRGRIDRIDCADVEDKLYVKVIDYKSGNKKFNLLEVYYGLQLQLVVYLNAAMELERKKHPQKEIIPAAMLYYHMDDPSVEESSDLSEDMINQKIKEQLKLVGVVNEDETIVSLLDAQMEDKSDIIPVAKKKDGSYSSTSSVMSTENLSLISSYVNHKIQNIGRQIVDGNIAIHPCKPNPKVEQSACTYCDFKSVCMFDENRKGFSYQELTRLTEAEITERMVEELNGKD